MTSDQLHRQLEFVTEIDQLKQVFRQTLLIADGRRENDAEHSWHLAIMACLLVDTAAETVDLLRVVKMLLIHDVVEIDAGDTFAYDVEGNEGKLQRERAAADRLFAILPAEQGQEFRHLWEEFEAMKSPEARFAAAIDRFQPLLLNYHSGGATWRRHGVRRAQVVKRNRHIRDGAPELWDYAKELIARAVDEGRLEP